MPNEETQTVARLGRSPRFNVPGNNLAGAKVEKRSSHATAISVTMPLPRRQRKDYFRAGERGRGFSGRGVRLPAITRRAVKSARIEAGTASYDDALA